MPSPAANKVAKATDEIQHRLVSYAHTLTYDCLSQEAIHAAKVRVIDTLGALVAGYNGESCRMVRRLAMGLTKPDGSTVIGTTIKTTPEMAAFVNATTARYVEMNDVYLSPGSFGGHPSDVVTPVLAVAEYVQASAQDLIMNVVLAFEVYCRISDIFDNEGFDNTNFGCIGTAVAAGKLLHLSPQQLSHCISMAVVPNNMLQQARRDHVTMYKAVAAGEAGRAGIFAALLAREGIEGPHLPFAGRAGWCNHVARRTFTLDLMGGKEVPFKILSTQIKIRPAAGGAISAVLTAEKIAKSIENINDIEHVTVEVYKKGKEANATGEHQWNPDSRESADHSIPFLVAATLLDGQLTLDSFDETHIWNPELRALIKKIDVTENEEFTKAYHRLPQEHRARITIRTVAGETLIDEARDDKEDLAAKRSDAQIEEKFRNLTAPFIDLKRANSILTSLWHLEDMANASVIPPLFVLS